MITARCPSCGHEYRIPPTFVGKKIRCKVEGCKQIFKVAKEVEVAFSEDISEASALPLESSESEYELEKGSYELEPIPNYANQAEQFESSSISIESSEFLESDRYGNLKKYLIWSKQLAFLQLVLIYITAAILLISAILASIFTFASGIELLIGILVSAIIAGIGYVIYVFTLAGIEFVFVIIDIESNTRSSRNQA